MNVEKYDCTLLHAILLVHSTFWVLCKETVCPYVSAFPSQLQFLQIRVMYCFLPSYLVFKVDSVKAMTTSFCVFVYSSCMTIYLHIWHQITSWVDKASLNIPNSHNHEHKEAYRCHYCHHVVNRLQIHPSNVKFSNQARGTGLQMNWWKSLILVK